MKRSLLFLGACAALFVFGCSKGSDDTSSSTSTGTTSSGTTGGSSTTDNSAAGSSTTGTSTTGASTTSAAGGTGGYAAVQGIFNKSCMPCHGGGGGGRGPAAGIDLSSYDGAMKGGRRGPVITAGDPDGSELVKAVSGPNPKMPKNKPPLSPDDIKTISDWIKAGAKNS